VTFVDEQTERRDHLRLASSRSLSVIDGFNIPDPVDEPLAYGTPRPALKSIAVRVYGDGIEATATLALDGRILTGQSMGDASDRIGIIASATLGAVSGLLGCEAEVEQACVADISGHEIALTILRLDAGDPHDLLIGSALIRGDVEDATARSVLSALNRRLSR
jgi:hypothetical protein